MSQPKRIVIIGNSAAGIGALESFRRHDRESAVTVISDEPHRLYSRCLLSYFLDGSVEPSGLSFRSDDYLDDLNAKFVLGKQVVRVDPDSQILILQDDTRQNYDRLLIATGGTPKMPKQIDSHISGVYVLRTLNDATAISERMDRAKNTFVLGGGLVGLKAAVAFHKAGLNVTVVVRSPHVLSQMIDYDAARIVMSRLKESNIRVLTQSDILRVESRESLLTGVKVAGYDASGSVTEERVLPCDILIVAKGVKANTELVQGTAVKCHRGIETDAEMRTSVENIFAAGDVAETYDVATEEQSINALWTCAIQQGRVAGSNMAGQTRQYDGSVGMNSINFQGVDLISFGAIKGDKASGCDTIVDNRPEEGVYKKLVLKDGMIKGLILVNQIDTAGILLSLLRRRIDVTELKDEILNDRFNFARLAGKRGQVEMIRYGSAAKTTESGPYG